MLAKITNTLLSFATKAIWSIVKHGVLLFVVWGIPLAILCGTVSYSNTFLQPVLAIALCLLVVTVVGVSMVIKSAKVTVLAEAIESAGVGKLAMSQLVNQLDRQNQSETMVNKHELSAKIHSAAEKLIGSAETTPWYQFHKTIARGMSTTAIWGTVSVINFFYSNNDGQINIDNVKEDLSTKIDQKLKDQILTQSNRLSFVVCGFASVACLVLSFLIRFVPSPF